MRKTNAFSKNTREEPRQGNFVKEVLLDLDDLLRIEREEGTEKTWQSIEEKLGKEMADKKRAEFLQVWEVLTKPPMPSGLSAEWYEKYKDKPFSWEGFDRSFGKAKQEESMLPEEVEDSFERLSRRKYFKTDSRLIKDLPKLVPFHLSEKYLVEKTETPGEIIAKYQKPFGNELVTYVFMIPKEEYKERRIPTFGDNARKVLLATVAFAIEEKTLHPRFRKYHILKFINKDKIENVDYSRLDNILQTLAFASYDISNKKKGKEYRRSIGHIIDNVDWLGKGKNAHIYVSLNQKYFGQLASWIEEKETLSSYLDLPKDRLTKTESRDAANFLNWLDGLEGLKEVHPILIKTIFTEKLGYTREGLKKLGPGRIATKLDCCLGVAKASGRLRDPYWKYNYGENKSFRKILSWKLQIYLAKERTQETQEKPNRKPDRREKRNTREGWVESEKYRGVYENREGT